MTDEEALAAANVILDRDVPNPGKTWLLVVDLCLWVKEAHKRLPKPKLSHKEYMRQYMRLRRAKEKQAKQQVSQ